MRKWFLIILALFVVVAIATGCGRDDTARNEAPRSAAPADVIETPDHDDRADADLRGREGLRACLDGVGYRVEVADKGRIVRVKSASGRPQAVVLIYKTQRGARKNERERRAQGLETDSFGRAEVNYFGRAVEPGADQRAIADCVRGAYG
jgi:hypothetical protein